MLRTILHKSLAAVVLLLSLFFYSFEAAADTSGALSEVEHLKENSFSCRFDGIKHKFILDLPEQTDGAPLVLMLPGYGNTAESFRSTVHFEQEANAGGDESVKTVEKVIAECKIRTPDLGGSSKTIDVANEVIKEINNLN